MNIQIFGTKKNFDSKKAERYFKERGIKYQFIDMKEKGMSKGEFQSVCQSLGGYEKLIDREHKDKDLLVLLTLRKKTALINCLKTSRSSEYRLFEMESKLQLDISRKYGKDGNKFSLHTS